MSQKSATIAVIHNNKVLLLKRGKTAPWQPEKFCLPGGGMENDESIIDAATRECCEETGLCLNQEPIGTINVQYNNGYSKIVCFCTIDSPKVTLNFEHSEYIWADFSQCVDMYSNKVLVPRLFYVLKCLLKNNLIS